VSGRSCVALRGYVLFPNCSCVVFSKVWDDFSDMSSALRTFARPALSSGIDVKGLAHACFDAFHQAGLYILKVANSAVLKY